MLHVTQSKNYSGIALNFSKPALNLHFLGSDSSVIMNDTRRSVVRHFPRWVGGPLDSTHPQWFLCRPWPQGSNHSQSNTYKKPVAVGLFTFEDLNRNVGYVGRKSGVDVASGVSELRRKTRW